MLGLAGQGSVDRRAAGVVVIEVDGIEVITGRSDPIGSDNGSLVLGFGRKRAVKQRFGQGLGDTGLGRDPSRCRASRFRERRSGLDGARGCSKVISQTRFVFVGEL